MSAVEDFLDDPFAETPATDCVAFVSDNHTHEVVANVAPQFFPGPLVRDGDSSDALQYLSDAQQPKVLIIDIGESSDPVSAMLSLTTAFPEDIRLIGIGSVNDISLYRELLEAGIVDYLVKPVTEKALASALTRIDEAPPDIDKVGPQSQRISVIGTRGGAGATTVAVNLAWLLAEERQKQTILVDLDLWFGTAALSLDLEPTRGLREALEDPSRIDSLFLASATAKLSERLSVMATEESLTGDMIYNTGSTEILLDSLSHNFECVVLDLPRSAFRMRHPVLQSSTQIIVVTEMSLPGLRDSIRLMEAVREAAEDVPMVFVANRVGGNHEAMSLAEFQKALNRKVDIQIVDDFKAFKDAANNGKPIIQHAPRSKAAKSLRLLAKRCVPEQEGAAEKSPRTLFKRLAMRA